MMPAPIALFVYNRPEHTRRTLVALGADPLSRESELTVFCDGPKTPEHVLPVQEVRELVRSAAGFRSVRIVLRDHNLGLAASITDGVSRQCAESGRTIVLEDDLVVAPGFLAFMNAGLERYENDARVMQISGYQFPGEVGAADEAVFLPLISCWGWATWRRAWDCYDPTASGYERLRRDAALRQRFNLGGAYDYFGMLQEQVEGRLDSWGVRWLLSVFLRDGLVLFPGRTLVQNIGVDGSGTHGAGVSSLQGTLPAGSLRPAIRLPDSVQLDQKALEAICRMLRAQRTGLARRLVRKLFA